MKKDFDAWNENKKDIHGNDDSGIYFHEKDIWWCRLGINIGFEQDGKGKSFSRPILVVRKFNQFVFWGIPLSTRMKKNPYYILCKSSDNVPRMAIISQLRLISSKRLTDKMGHVEDKSFAKIRKAAKDLL